MRISFPTKASCRMEIEMASGCNIGTSHRNRNPYARLGINYYIVSYSDMLDIFNNIIRPSAACITHVTRGQKWKPITSLDITLGIILLSVITTYRCQPLSPSAAGASFQAFVDDEKRLSKFRLHNIIL